MSKLLPGITVCIPTIPPRAALLRRALDSVLAQTLPAAALSVAVDLNREGAASTRQRALDAVQTEWAAFLDDDDELLPSHLTELAFAAHEHQALYLWSRFRVAFPDEEGIRMNRAGGNAPEHYFPFREGDPNPLGAGTFEQWNDEQPAQTTVTTMVRTELARDVGGFAPPTDGEIDGQRAGEDWYFTLRCRAAAGLSGMRHVPVTTWLWHHHGKNTSGLSDRW